MSEIYQPDKFISESGAPDKKKRKPVARGQRQRRDGIMRVVDMALYNANAIRQAVAEARQDGRDGEKLLVPPKAVFTDPTAKQAVVNLSELKSIVLASGRTVKLPERWLKVIDAVYDGAEAIEREVMRRRFWKREHYVKTIIALNISAQTYYAALDRVRNRVLCGACELGILTIFE